MPTFERRILGGVEDEQRRAIEAELLRIEESAEYSSNSQFEQAKLWRGTNLVLGVPAATLAAVAGATALAATAGRVAAGILALCAAGLGAVMTTLNAARRAEQAHVAGNDYLGLLRMEELTRADLATLKSGDRLLVKDYDADGEGDYIDHVVVVVEVERDGEEFAVVWHLEHPDYDHDEALDGEVVEEMLGSLYRLD